jgi:benzoate-CoA ligase family protein
MTMPGYVPPETFNLAGHLLDERVREGNGDRIALHTPEGTHTYREVQSRANRYAHLLQLEGVLPEQRVLIALPDGADCVGALFGTLKAGAVAVLVNPHQRADALRAVLDYSRAAAVLVDADAAPPFRAAIGASQVTRLLVASDALRRRLDAQPDVLENFPSHRDDAAIWLFSGGTSGRPKAVVQTHRSFANTTELYGRRVLELTGNDITISVPKLYFGYAMGSNLFFPFSVGGSAVLFPERCTPETIFDRIEQHRPTVLVNVPTMVQQMVVHPGAGERDLSSVRVATSAGEALPVELYHRWRKAFGVELLDGLGTAEMWHIFISGRMGEVRPGTLGRAVDGFDVRVRDEEGREVATGEVGYLWVRGESRAIAYWQNMEATRRAFRGDWYVSEDMLSRDEDGYFTYRGRADDMLKVSGRWLSPQEVENCLLQHDAVGEAAVVGVVEQDGLTRPHAFVVPAAGTVPREEDLLEFVKERLESYKAPRRITIVEALPRTHLGKVDRGRLRAPAPVPDAG